MRTVIVLQWLAARAGLGTRFSGAGADGVTTADRAARLVPVPGEELEPEVGRSLIENGAMWLLIGFVLLLLGIGYLRRRWRRRASAKPAWARLSRFAQRRPR